MTLTHSFQKYPLQSALSLIEQAVLSSCSIPNTAPFLPELRLPVVFNDAEGLLEQPLEDKQPSMKTNRYGVLKFKTLLPPHAGGITRPKLPRAVSTSGQVFRSSRSFRISNRIPARMANVIEFRNVLSGVAYEVVQEHIEVGRSHPLRNFLHNTAHGREPAVVVVCGRDVRPQRFARLFAYSC